MNYTESHIIETIFKLMKPEIKDIYYENYPAGENIGFFKIAFACIMESEINNLTQQGKKTDACSITCIMENVYNYIGYEKGVKVWKRKKQ